MIYSTTAVVLSQRLRKFNQAVDIFYPEANIAVKAFLTCQVSFVIKMKEGLLKLLNIEKLIKHLY